MNRVSPLFVLLLLAAACQPQAETTEESSAAAAPAPDPDSPEARIASAVSAAPPSIGSNATILCGVTVGEGAIVGAGSDAFDLLRNIRRSLTDQGPRRLGASRCAGSTSATARRPGRSSSARRSRAIGRRSRGTRSPGCAAQRATTAAPSKRACLPSNAAKTSSRPSIRWRFCERCLTKLGHAVGFRRAWARSGSRIFHG